jgi:hypothetical protein
MKSPLRHRWIFPPLLGAVLAAIVYVLLVAGAFDSIASKSHAAGAILNLAFAPAEWIVQAVHYFRLPPHGDAGFVWFVIAPSIEWFLIGTVVGFIWCRFQRKVE